MLYQGGLKNNFLLKFKNVPILLVFFWTKTKETDFKIFWPLEGVKPLK